MCSIHSVVSTYLPPPPPPPHTHTPHRHNSTGDRLSATPDSSSPAPADNPSLLKAHLAPHAASSVDVTGTGRGKASRRVNGATTYDSSTLPLRRPRNRVSVDEKNKKVGVLVYFLVSNIDMLGLGLLLLNSLA